MSPGHHIVLPAILTTWSTFIVTATAVACYAPGGHERNAQTNTGVGDHYAPCDPTAKFSMCCAIGPARVVEGSADICDNGLCRNGNLLWRESCTDPTWNSPSCLKLFVNGTGMAGSGLPMLQADGYNVSDVTLTMCDEGSYCFGAGNRACCREGKGVWLVKGQQYPANPNITSGNTSTLATSTRSTSSQTISPSSSSKSIDSSLSSSVSLSSTSNSAIISPSAIVTTIPLDPSPSAIRTPSSSALTTPAKAGISIAALAVLFALTLSCGLVYTRRRRHSRGRSTLSTSHPDPAVREMPATQIPTTRRMELPTTAAAAEMPNSTTYPRRHRDESGTGKSQTETPEKEAPAQG